MRREHVSQKLSTAWFHGAGRQEDKESIESTVRNSTAVLERLRKILEDREDELRSTSIKETNLV
jgi:hypothetical protein